MRASVTFSWLHVTGASEEFAALDRTLLTIWSCLESLGSHPVLLTVPGNHALVRPPAGDPRLAEFARWPADLSVAQRFWAEPASPQRALVTEAFANYARWWSDHRFPRVPGHRAGLLPASFTTPPAATVAARASRGVRPEAFTIAAA